MHTHMHKQTNAADVFQNVLRLSKQLATSLARPAKEPQQLAPRLDDAAGDGYRQGYVVCVRACICVSWRS